jgi:hypothetical protein
MTQSPTAASAHTGVSDDGTFTIVVTATDGSTPANTTTCNVQVTVNDSNVPTFTCPAAMRGMIYLQLKKISVCKKIGICCTSP